MICSYKNLSHVELENKWFSRSINAKVWLSENKFVIGSMIMTSYAKGYDNNDMPPQSLFLVERVRKTNTGEAIVPE